MPDEDLMRVHVELLRQQNATLLTIAKHTRLQYMLTSISLALLAVAFVVGIVVFLSDSTGFSVETVVITALIVVGALTGLIALAAKAETQARAAH